MSTRYVILDRDGTVIVEKNYLASPEGVEVISGAAEALAAIRALGWGVVLVTNQSGIGRGYFTRETVDAVHAHLSTLLAPNGMAFDGIYVCPHRPDEECDCRKPRTGLVLRAAAELGFDPREAVVVGDKRCDLLLGRGVDAVTCLVRTGYGRTAEVEERGNYDYVIDDISGLPELIARIDAETTASR